MFLLEYLLCNNKVISCREASNLFVMIYNCSCLHCVSNMLCSNMVLTQCNNGGKCFCYFCLILFVCSFIFL